MRPDIQRLPLIERQRAAVHALQQKGILRRAITGEFQPVDDDKDLNTIGRVMTKYHLVRLNPTDIAL
jgi:hypothetical protein